jgi:16S rRNA (uracil1498-N3)-methyltransferase
VHRLFVPVKYICVGEIRISDKEQLDHLKNVLRLKAGEKVDVFDDKGNEYNCEVLDLGKDAVLKIKTRNLLKKKAGTLFTIACAIPKKSKMDDIIDKLTQLGVDRIIPLETQRVIVKLDKTKKDLRLERWKKIAQNAAEQSQRSTLPRIEPVSNIKDVLSSLKDFDLGLIPTLLGERKTLRDAFVGKRPKSVLAFIGPEGDFTDEEVDLAVKAGCIPVSLGETVLRVETAAVAVASFIKLYENS